MYELKNIWKVFTNKFVGTGPLSYKKNLPGRGLTKVEKHCFRVPDIILRCSQKDASGPSPVLLHSFCTFSQSRLLASGPVLFYFHTYRKLPLQFSSPESVNRCLSYTRKIIFHNFRKRVLYHNPSRMKHVYWLQHQFTGLSLVKAKSELCQDYLPRSHVTSLH
jgi:hypothetical protein